MCQKQGCGPVQGVWSPSPSPLSSSAPPEKLTSPEASLLCRSCIMSFRHMMSLNSHFTDEEIESPRVKVYKAYKWQRTDSVSRTPEPMFPPLPCTALLSQMEAWSSITQRAKDTVYKCNTKTFRGKDEPNQGHFGYLAARAKQLEDGLFSTAHSDVWISYFLPLSLLTLLLTIPS